MLGASHGGVGLGLLGADLVGAGLDGLGRLKARLRELLQGLRHLGLAGDYVGFGLEDSGLVGCVCRDGGVVLLFGDDVLLDEGGVALDVEVRLDGIGLGCDDAGLSGLLLLAGLLDAGGGALDVGTGGVDAGVDVHAGDGYVNRLLDSSGLWAGKVGLGLLEGYLVVLGVDLGDGLAD